MGRLQLAESPLGTINIKDYYINVPTPDGNIIKVREDKFDNLNPDEWQSTMDYLEPYNADPSINGLFSKWRENKATRKDARAERKESKIRTRDEGRLARVQAGGGIGGVLGKVGGIVGNIFGKGGGDSDQDQMPSQRDLTIGYTDTEKKWYQNPMVLVGGIAVLGLGTYLLTRKKK